MLTETQRNEYLLSGGLYCPYCGSRNIRSEQFEPDSNSVETNCDGCGKSWNNIYTLTEVEER